MPLTPIPSRHTGGRVCYRGVGPDTQQVAQGTWEGVSQEKSTLAGAYNAMMQEEEQGRGWHRL